MFLNVKRYFMSEVDSGSGNGAAPAAPTQSENVPQAQGDVVTLSKADLDEMLSSTAAKAVAAAKDGIYAEARRTFTESKKTKTPPTDAAQAQSQTAPDPMRMRALDRALSKHGVADKLSDSQYRRIEKQFADESPDDAGSWVKDYFDGLGFAATQPAPAQAAPPAAKPATEHPLSNRGAPPPTQVPLDEADLVSMSESDRRAYIQQKGASHYVKQLQKQLKGRPVQIR